MATTVLSNLNASAAAGIGGGMIPPYWAPFLRETLRANMYVRQMGTVVTIPKAVAGGIKIPRFTAPVGFTGTNLRQWGGTSNSAIGFDALGANESTAATAVARTWANNISGILNRFHGAYEYTDQVTMQLPANFIEESVKALAENMAWRVDRYLLAAVISGNSLQLAVNSSFLTVAAAATATKTTSVLKGKSLTQLVPRFEAAGVPPFSDGLYIGLMHPYVKADLWADTSANGIVPVYRYGPTEKILRGEMGKIYGIRFLASPTLARFSGSASISAGNTGTTTYFFGRDGFYVLEAQSGGLSIYNNPLGSSGTADPTAVKGAVGAKLYLGGAAAPSAEGRIIAVSHGLSMVGA